MKSEDVVFTVGVLLATRNGVAWLANQVDSILEQKEVKVVIYVSDDFSQDGSYEYLLQKSSLDSRVRLLPRTLSGSAGKNFYRLIRDVDITAFDYLAFSDQDDVWSHDKLTRHIHLSKQHQAEGVSSDVTAFWSDGRSKLIVKSQPQRKLDFLFESAGPGCTFLMTPWLASVIKQQLLISGGVAESATMHDWLCYAICRSQGRRWLVDNVSTVMYRQHDINVIGANVGIKAKFSRIKDLKDHWYRNEVIKMAKVSQALSFEQNIESLLISLSTKNFINQLKLLRFIPHARRRLLDRVFLALAILTGLF